jgi:hypothetical protein
MPDGGLGFRVEIEPMYLRGFEDAIEAAIRLIGKRTTAVA